MQLKTEDRGTTRLITVGEPRIDAAIAIQFKDAIRSAAGDTARRIVIDMSSVGFLDSSGLGALVAAMKMLGPERKLELASLGASVERVFRLTRMDKVFAIHASVTAAFGPTSRLADAG
jgi:anti-sigma B factor antagonist